MYWEFLSNNKHQTLLCRTVPIISESHCAKSVVKYLAFYTRPLLEKYFYKRNSDLLDAVRSTSTLTLDKSRLSIASLLALLSAFYRSQ